MIGIVRRIVHIGALFICVVCVMSIAILFAQSTISERMYANFRASSFFIDPDEGQASSEAPRNAGDTDLVAWIDVQGTHVSYPVVQPAEELPRDWYLTHNVWGEWDPFGCPYLDRRCTTDGLHLLVFGHHMQGTNQMFSDLSDSHQQDTFDALGIATWTLPSGETTAFSPLCALSVDASEPEIQRFSFADETELRSWLNDIAQRADALSPDAATAIDQTTRVLTLVTCSEAQAGGRTRTLTVFAASE